MKRMKPPMGRKKLLNTSSYQDNSESRAKMCGLCGTKHAPGEPHRARNAASFNVRTGKAGPARVGGGYIGPHDSHRTLGMKKASMAS